MSGRKPSGMDPNGEETNRLVFFCSGWCVVGVGMDKRNNSVSVSYFFLIPTKHYYFSGETRTPNNECRVGILAKRNPVPLIPRSPVCTRRWSYLVLPGYKEKTHVKSHGQIVWWLCVSFLMCVKAWCTAKQTDKQTNKPKQNKRTPTGFLRITLLFLICHGLDSKNNINPNLQ